MRKDLPEDLQGPLAGISDQTLPIASFAYGTQVCEVEVDPETGEVQIIALLTCTKTPQNRQRSGGLGCVGALKRRSQLSDAGRRVAEAKTSTG